MKKNKKINLISILSTILLSLSGCSSINTVESKSTSYPNDACLMLKENPDWLNSLSSSFEKWNTPISIQLAFIRQESSFKHDAQPVRKNKWNEFGINYQSSALGYSQALNATWSDYEKNTKQFNRDRTSFNHSSDFIGWYNYKSRDNLQLSRLDSYSLYLAYHEGWGGFKNKTYHNKPFLKKAGWKVQYWSRKYSTQLNNCKLKRS